MAITALLYNYGFFTLLAYTPFPLDMGAYPIGFIFFGWGLTLAVSSVFRLFPDEGVGRSGASVRR